MRQLTLLKHFAVLTAGILTVSCSGIREMYPALPDTETVLQTDSITFSAYIGEDSRTQLGENMDVRWSDGDKVRVFTAAVPQGIEFNLVGGAGTTKGVFVGPAVGEGPYFAVYPSQSAVEMTGDALTINLPSSQSYAAGSFGQGAGISAGTADQLDGVHFHNLIGAIQLTLSGNKAVTGIRICSYDEGPLHGPAVINEWDKAVPSLTMEAGLTDDAYRELFLDCGEGVALTEGGTTFHLTVPAGVLGGGYRIEVYDSEGLAMVKYAKADPKNQVDRNEVVQMPSFAFQPVYKTDFLLSDKIGAFSNAGEKGEMTLCCSYVEEQSQFAFLNSTGQNTRYLRLEDWDAGYALGLTMPYTLTPGKNSRVTVKSLGLPLIQSGEVEKMQVIKISDEKVWMLDPGSGNGFILMMVED